LLDQVARILGVKNYSEAVNAALTEVLRVRKIQELPQFFGKGLWNGNLAEMREDKNRRRVNHASRRQSNWRLKTEN
jgi:Arc/MetJ family transcription regulator